MSTCYSNRSVFGELDAAADQNYEGRRPERNRGPRRRALTAAVKDNVGSWFAWQGAVGRGAFENTAAIEAKRGNLAAQELMTRDVVTVRPDDSIESAARLMEQFDCSALPVVDRSNLLLGIITDRDITIRLVAKGLNAGCAQVSDCMTDQAFACDAGSSMQDCLRAMAWFEVRRIPIVDADHRLIGIVSQADIVRHSR